MYVNKSSLYLVSPNNLENRYGAPFTINSILSDITKMILKYHKIKLDFFLHKMLKSIFISQNSYVHVMQQIRFCDITKSNL